MCCCGDDYAKHGNWLLLSWTFLLLRWWGHSRSQPGNDGNHLEGQIAQKFRASGFLGEGFRVDAQVGECVARVRIATGRIPKSQEPIVDEGRHQGGSTTAKKSISLINVLLCLRLGFYPMNIMAVTGKRKISENAMVFKMLTHWTSATPMAIRTGPKDPGPKSWTEIFSIMIYFI